MIFSYIIKYNNVYETHNINNIPTHVINIEYFKPINRV